MARQARRDMKWSGMARYDKAGKARLGQAWRGQAGSGLARQAWPGEAGLGGAWLGEARQGRYGKARLDRAR